MTPSLELCDLTKRFGGVLAVDRVSFAVAPGRVFGLLGPNGAGKTTTIRMIMDILAPDSGRILFFGRERRAGSLPRIGYLPEERGLYKKMTVLSHLAFLGRLRGLSRREVLPIARHWLERVGLGDRARAKVEELSKGMQQKIQLVATLLHDPEILILDEPFSGLDPINQGLFREILVELKQRGRSIVLSTHVMEHAEKLCDSICLVSQGHSILTGDLARLKREFGGNSYRLVARGDLARIASLPGVADSAPVDGIVRLTLEPEASGPAVLRELVRAVDVLEFQSQEPDLEEIFVRAVQREA